MRGTELVLWLAVAAAFSPAIAEFVRGFGANYSPWSTLLAPVLIAVCLLRGVARPAGPPEGLDRRGIVLLLAGGLLQIVGSFTRTWTVEWLGLPVALIGMAWLLGRPPLPVAVLALGVVPVPVSLVKLFTPVPETLLLSGACAVVKGLSPALACVGPRAIAGDAHIELGGADVGLPLAAVLGELGWFLAVSRGFGWRRALSTALCFAACTLVLQPAAIVVALGLLAAGAPDAARGWLDQGVWLGCAIVTVTWSLRTDTHGAALSAGAAGEPPEGSSARRAG